MLVSTVAFVVTVLAVTEIVPKTVGVVHADRLVIPITGVVQVMIVAVWPMLFLTRWLARCFARPEDGPSTSLDEIRILATAGMSQGAFGKILSIAVSFLCKYRSRFDPRSFRKLIQRIFI